MLVYANNFELIGENPTRQVLGAVAKWFKEKLGERVLMREITRQGEREGGTPHCWVRTDTAKGEGFKLYSWVLKHPDASVAGRQWITELGLKEVGGNSAEFSCVVYTEEQSTIVSESVQASRPRVVKFVFENVEDKKAVQFSPGTIGSGTRWVGESVESYRALLAEIEQPDRSFPIVLVSPSNDGNYAVDPKKLQRTLFGLAQVVGVGTEFNSYEMEEVLGRNYSSWAGAINIIRIPHRDGRIFNYLIQQKDIPQECDNPYKRECFVLGRVSHNTNIPLQRNRIRPEGVRTLAAQNHIRARVSKMLVVNRGEDVREELEMVYEELTKLTDQLSAVQQSKEGLELTLIEAEEKNQDLERRLRSKRFHAQNRSHSGSSPTPDSVVGDFLKVAASSSEPTPQECLELIALAYPEKVVMLDSAFESSLKVANFQQGRRLLDMLRRLILEYLPTYLNSGDNAARDCFTKNEFSARESDAVTNNKEYMRHRQFEVNGVLVEMTKHLKIGVADDPSKTIRVHFEVLQVSKKIAIGHCGIHLPLPGH